MEENLINTFRYRINNWWLSLLIGILAIILGIWCAAAIPQTLVALSMLFIAGFIVSGLANIFFAIANKRKIEGWGWSFASGLVDLAIASVLIYMPINTVLVLILYVGFWIMFQSFWGLSAARHLRKRGVKGSVWLVILSIIGILLSFILILNPAFASGFIVMLTSISFICYGILRVYYSFKLREIGKVMEDIMDKK